MDLSGVSQRCAIVNIRPHFGNTCMLGERDQFHPSKVPLAQLQNHALHVYSNVPWRPVQIAARCCVDFL